MLGRACQRYIWYVEAGKMLGKRVVRDGVSCYTEEQQLPVME